MRKLYKLRNCAFCGEMKETLSGLCDQCADAWAKATDDRESFDDGESDGSPMCVMCGKEWGTSIRKDGKFYCSHCWMVWTS